MASSPTSFDPRQLAKLRGLRLRARHIVEGHIAGQHRSPRHGFSIEFAEPARGKQLIVKRISRRIHQDDVELAR